MGDIQTCLDLKPLSEEKTKSKLNPLLSVFKSIWASMLQIHEPKAQLRVLCEGIAHFIISLRMASKMQDDIDDVLPIFTSVVEDVAGFLQRESSYNSVRTLLARGEKPELIASYVECFEKAANLFGLPNSIDIQNWKRQSQAALINDHSALNMRFRELEADQDLLQRFLDLETNNPLAIMAAFKKRIENNQGGETERRFLAHCLRYLSNITGGEVELDAWTITSFDIHIEKKIGTGGFGAVFQGSWNGRVVALKTLNNESHVAPRLIAIHREIETWSKLRHAHVLEFLGANILDNKPFIVMPLIKNGNALDYIYKNPTFSRQSIIQHVSLGLVYLHSQNIVHGDLKASNVLIDDNGNALLCDFGLSRLKADVNTRTQDHSPVFVGSQNWMAPELFRGGSLRSPCDIYSFGMTIYEIFTTETPLGTVPTMEALRRLVVEEDVRPEQPEQHEAPQLTPDIWKIATQCWLKDPSVRPKAKEVYERLARSSTRPPVPPPLPPRAESTKQKGDEEQPARQVLRKRGSLAQQFFQKNRRSASEPNTTSIPEIEIAEEAKRGLLRRFSSSVLKRRRPSEIIPEDLQWAGNAEVTPIFPFMTPFKRCLSLDHPRNVAILSLSGSGTHLGVGLEVAHVEIWDIVQPKRISMSRTIQLRQKNVAIQPIDPIVTLDFQNTFAGRFLISATSDHIRVRETTDIMRNSVRQWDGKQPNGAPEILHVQFQGGNFCDSVAIVNVEHRIRRGPKSAVSGGQASMRQLSGVSSDERTCLHWPRGSKIVFVGVKGGDILVYDATTGQAVSKPLVFGDAQLERSGAGDPVHPGFQQDGLADEHVRGSHRQQPKPPPADCRSMAYSPATKKLVACYSNGEIRGWDINNRTYDVLRVPQKDVVNIFGDLFVIACSPNEPFLVYPSLFEEKTVLFQDINTAVLLGSVFLPECPRNRMTSIIISPDRKKRKIIASFERSPSVKIWCWD